MASLTSGLRTQMYFWLSLVPPNLCADVIFGGDKRQPEIRLRSQAKRRPAAAVETVDSNQ